MANGRFLLWYRLTALLKSYYWKVGAGNYLTDHNGNRIILKKRRN